MTLAADVDRERIVERLRTAAGEGRLRTDELERRLERALSARTYAELDALVADLPSARPPRRAPRRAAELRAFAAIGVLMIVIWAATGAGYFWPVWPLLGWGVCLAGPAYRRPAQVGFRACRRNAS